MKDDIFFTKTYNSQNGTMTVEAFGLKSQPLPMNTTDGEVLRVVGELAKESHRMNRERGGTRRFFNPSAIHLASLPDGVSTEDAIDDLAEQIRKERDANDCTER